MMKRFILFAALITYVTVSFAGAVIIDFRAETATNQVILKWIVTAEQGLQGYRILRSMDGASFQKVGFVAALGVSSNERSYSFIDKSVFKSANRTYHYKIQLVNSDGSVDNFEKSVTVSPQISSARQTWGSLKAMFR
ncbi:hypothetical protein JW998_03385 [candidate division KSB1 bacterium]|nr:hypothetical protein [candidate division KSB1 bacterium]